jgi:hypothetical protein
MSDDNAIGAARQSAEIFEADVFRAHLGTEFRLAVDGVPLPLRLAEVVDGRAGGGFRRFSAIFHGPADRPLGQGSYEFQHGTLGAFLLFIVPLLESNRERMVYEACFSRPMEPEDRR